MLLIPSGPKVEPLISIRSLPELDEMLRSCEISDPRLEAILNDLESPISRRRSIEPIDLHFAIARFL